ncbi:MAG: ABC transporter ATP-binding protein [Planctomycetaceae bacterium]|jgi:iron complex transport system ATP-binding protein|nr:ABC transporter ATP-binding protein [Planctomycetaceae bacterium]
MLRVNEISFRYKDNTVLDKISFTANRGEIITILGPNGSGKSTLLRCLGGLLSPCAGGIYVDGKKLDKISVKTMSRCVAYVPQRIETSMMVVFDAVILGRRPYFGLMPSAADLDLVESMIYRFQLETIADRAINQLSGGEVQKVAIARSFVQEPQLLLLDEPTSMLDLRNQVELLMLLRQFVSERNITAVLCMHDINSAMKYTDRFLLLRKGQIIFDVKKDNLTAEMIESLYNLPVEIHKINNSNFVTEKMSSENIRLNRYDSINHSN